MENIIKEKSKGFAVRIIRLYQYLEKKQRGFALANQILRSGTSIGANVREALQGQSRADFTAKMSIALKEACETEYWLELLLETEYISKEQFESLSADNDELIKILVSIIKTSKQ